MPQLFPFTDFGNAQQLVQDHKEKIRYCTPWGKWLCWDGNRWVNDATNAIMRYAKQTLRDLYGRALNISDNDLRGRLEKHARESESVIHLRAMITLAQSEPEVAVVPKVFDADPWLLNCLNGTIDLRSGQLQQHNPKDLITKITPVIFDPQADCPTLKKFLDRIMRGNSSLLNYLQRVAGYALTGDAREQVVFIFYGSGANGKTTFLETLAMLIGDYGSHTPAESLLVKNGNGIGNDVARLAGKRFVLASESEEGRKLASAQIKTMTGGDVLTARFLYGEFFEFRPQFKIFLATNHVPIIYDTTHSIWRRIHLVPFAVQIPEGERDKALGEKLRQELSGSLNWAVQGCLAWQQEGLKAPPEVKKATLDFKNEMDILEVFFQINCVINPSGRVGAQKLIQRFRDWAAATGERPLTGRELKQRMQEKGFQSARSGSKGNVEWHGIALK